MLALIGNGEDFKTPRTQQWNAGVQRQLYARGALEVSYVGSHGDHLIRPIDINYPQPADVLRLGSVNLAVTGKLCRNVLLADVPAIIGSIDIVMGEVDR